MRIAAFYALHQVINRNPDIARATGLTADGVTPWTSNRCCQGGYPMAQSDISSPQSITVVDRSPGFKMWDASSAMRTWLASAPGNFGLLLNADIRKGNNRFRTFSSAPGVANLESSVLARDLYGTRRRWHRNRDVICCGNGRCRHAGIEECRDLAERDWVTGRGGRDWRFRWRRANRPGHLQHVGGTVVNLDVRLELRRAGNRGFWHGGRSADAGGLRRRWNTNLAFYRPSTGAWHLWLSSTRIQRSVQWGGPDDQPITVDHDGDGKADLALVRNGRGRYSCRARTIRRASPCVDAESLVRENRNRAPRTVRRSEPEFTRLHRNIPRLIWCIGLADKPFMATVPQPPPKLPALLLALAMVLGSRKAMPTAVGCARP